MGFKSVQGTEGGYGLLDYAQRLRGPNVISLTEIWRQTDRYQANTKKSGTEVVNPSPLPRLVADELNRIRQGQPCPLREPRVCNLNFVTAPRESPSSVVM